MQLLFSSRVLSQLFVGRNIHQKVFILQRWFSFFIKKSCSKKLLWYVYKVSWLKCLWSQMFLSLRNGYMHVSALNKIVSPRKISSWRDCFVILKKSNHCLRQIRLFWYKISNTKLWVGCFCMIIFPFFSLLNVFCSAGGPKQNKMYIIAYCLKNVLLVFIVPNNTDNKMVWINN